MTNLAALLIVLLIPLTIYSQYEQVVSDKKTQKELTKEQKKAEREIDRRRQVEIVDSMLTMREFVLEADFLSGKSGSRTPVSSNLNFIGVDSAEVTIQIGSITGVGYNGIGGITLDGRVTKYDLMKKVKEKGTSYTLIMYISTNLGTYDITFWISEEGNTSATIRGITSGQLSYSGRLVPWSESRVYKGSAL